MIGGFICPFSNLVQLMLPKNGCSLILSEFFIEPNLLLGSLVKSFEMKLALIQKDLGFLKNEIEKGTGKLLQQGKHRDQIVKALSKTVSGHVNCFKKALQIHIENSEIHIEIHINEYRSSYRNSYRNS